MADVTPARDDVFKLVDMAVALACDFIDKGMRFDAFAVVMTNDGEISPEYKESVPGQDIGDLLLVYWHSIQDRRKSLRAAIVVNQVGTEFTPALLIGGDHRNPDVPPFRCWVTLKWGLMNRRLQMDHMKLEPWPNVNILKS